MLVVCMSAAVYLGVKGVQELRDRKAGVDYYEQLGAQIGVATEAEQPAADDMAEEIQDARESETLLSDPDAQIVDVPRLQVDFESLKKT